MKNDLNDLIQEIINFGNVISFVDDPADSDFQNACQLFSRYLENRFSEIKSQPHIAISKGDINWTENQIAKLSNLVSLEDNSTTPYVQWTENLFKYCEELQHNKAAVA